jgi:replicative DNA helicase
MSYYLKCRKRLETDPAGISYLSARGISEETARRFWLGYDPDWKSPTAIKNGKNPPASPRLIIPITGAHYEARDIRPDHQAKPENGPDFRKMKEGRAATFNGKALLAQEVQEIFITEGAIDALSIIEAGGQAVGIASANRAQAFIDELTTDAANGKKTAATFVICLDNDQKGQAAAQTIRDGLQRLDIPFISADICGQYKDPNEHLQKDRAGFIEAVQKAQKTARRLNIDSGETDIDEFFDKVSTERYKAIPTGIDALDLRLSGGFVNEWLVIINAAPGAGKTVLATQICENMARSGRKCLYFNFEMSKDQLIARSIARIMDGGNNIGALDILRLYKQDQKTKEAVFKAGLIYKQHIAPNMLYNPDGTGPNLDRITEAMEARARKAEAKGEAAPVVCIDYLQMIEGAPKEDVKETIKRAVYAFKQYAQRHKSIVICISAQSRAANNDAEARQDAGRDTSNIEYSADLQLQIMSDPEDEDTRRLYITKSRFAAPSLKHYLAFNFNGKQGRFIFDHETESGSKKAGNNWSGRR